MQPLRRSQLLLPAILYLILAASVFGLPHAPGILGMNTPKLLGKSNDPQNQVAYEDHELTRREIVTYHHASDIGNGWNMYYSSWPSAFLPVQPAAWALVNLYMSIVLQAKNHWSKGPPQHGFTMSFGKIQIIMACPQKPIPWVFIMKFAEQLLKITEGGWTGVYSVMLSQAASDVSIAIELKVTP